MCRMAAYLGPEITLHPFLYAPPHGLVQQARAPQELRYATINADGFGFGWFDPAQRPASYVNPAPIWNDPNLPALAQSLLSPLWIGFVRSASDGMAVNHDNTQPFRDGELLFTHNGFLDQFNTYLRPAISAALLPDVAGAIRGNTDSEFLFALFRQILAEDNELALETALAELCARVDEWTDDHPALLNFIISEGSRLYAVRHACNDLCPSLYYTTDHDAFPGAQLIASEPFDDTGIWQPVPEHHILILDPDEPPELIEL